MSHGIKRTSRVRDDIRITHDKSTPMGVPLDRPSKPRRAVAEVPSGSHHLMRRARHVLKQRRVRRVVVNQPDLLALRSLQPLDQFD